MRVERYAQGRLNDGSLQQRWTATNALSLSSSIFHFAPSPLDTRDTPVTRRHIVASDRSIPSIPPHRGYRGERRGACSLPHDKCVAFLRVIALLQSMLCCACTRRYLTSITELRISANGGAHPFHGGQPP